jgi:alpha/beta superfamily hydrolase
VDVPDGAWAGAVLLHPHPDYGGDRHNVVVGGLYKALPAAGVAAVRFDFSSSDLDVATAEAVEAIDALPDGNARFMVGYSFGGAVAALVADARLAGWALVAPPFGALLPGSAARIGADLRPKLVLTPEHDQVCPPAVVLSETEGWLSATFKPVIGADHYMSGASARVAEQVVEWLRSVAGR